MLRVLVAALAWFALGGEAVADTSHVFAGLVPDAHEHVRARARGLERSLGSALETLPGVKSARVSLDLPDAACVPLDQPVPEARASVLLVVDENGSVPEAGRVRDLVQGAARELTNVVVHVTQSREAADVRSEPLVSVGPFRVARESASGFRLLLALSLLANVTLATVLIVRLRRNRTASGSS